MARFTKSLRQKIIREFAAQNGGIYDPADFLASVEAAGETHPAFEWFLWDDERAATEYRLDQARDFARGMVVKFQVETIQRGKYKIVEQEMPFALSPVGSRKSGGGYYLSDPEDPSHLEEHCRQAATSLRWFLSRYSSALQSRAISVTAFERAISKLSPEAVSEEEAA